METDDGRPTSAQSGADCSDAACLFVWSGWSCRASQTDADTADGRTDGQTAPVDDAASR